MSLGLLYQGDGSWETVRLNNDVIARALRPPLPQVRCTHSVNQTLVTNTATFLAFNTDRWNNGNMHSTATNNTRLTSKITGLYSISGHVSFAANATGARQLAIRLNGATFIGAVECQASATGGEATQLSIQTEYRLAANDYVELMAKQISGGNLDVVAAGNFSPEFAMHRVGGYTNEGIA